MPASLFFAKLSAIAIVGSVSLHPALAAAKSYDFNLSSNVEGSEVKAINARAVDSVLGQCLTPCTLTLKNKKLDYFVFSHPDYPNAYIAIDELDAALEKKTDVSLRASFGKSYAEMEADKEAAFQAQYAADFAQALVGPDAKPVPLRRTPPVFPPRAETSGWCHMGFDVSETGHPSNIKAIKCSEDLFESPSVKSMTKWRFIPKVASGRFVDMSGAEILITFRMLDDDNNIVPAPLAPPATVAQ